MSRAKETTMRILLPALCALFPLGCDRGSRYDAEASRAFRAAWEKRRAGDEAGYKAALTEVARRRGTWAGDRAALDLEIADDTGGGSLLSRLLRQAAELAGDPSKLPAGLPGVGGAPGPEDETPAVEGGERPPQVPAKRPRRR